jgi:hypothetical protein
MTPERDVSQLLAASLRDRRAGIGAYRLTRLIAQGGMGAVYETERVDEVFDKKVAVKICRVPVC